MNRSNVHLLDLPDEILLIILNKLNNIDVLYSLLDINNGRLNILAQENTFTNTLKFDSIHDISLINRFCRDILPIIHHNVKCFILDPVIMKRILRATDYPNLTELKIFHFQQEIVLKHFTNESSLRSILQEQITNLILINNDKGGMTGSFQAYTINVYSYILTFFKNLENLSVIGSPAVSYTPLSLCDLPLTTFSSSILTHLNIDVYTFDDCLYLLDGRLTQLTTLFVNVYSMNTSSGTVYIHNTDKLLNLKDFSLKLFYRFKKYDKIVSLLRRMSYLEKLSLCLRTEGQNRIIGGTCVQDDILNFMPQLHSFTFYICSYISTVNLSYKLTSEDIQQTLTNIRQQLQDASGIVNYGYVDITSCSIFSLPFQYDYFEDLGNNFPNIIFSYVTRLFVEDIHPFKHEFFIRIARSFPLLKYLRIYNIISPILHDRMTLSSDNSQFYSIIEYPRLTKLDVSYAHEDYIEQFLNETKTYIPCLTELRVIVDVLKVVTKDFTSEQTRRNCAKVKSLLTTGSFEYTEDLCLYFPSLYK